MKIKLLFVFVFCSSFLFAQINNEKGKILFNNGKSIKGIISYFTDQPTDIIVYDTVGAKNIFTSDEIKEIMLSNGKKFVSKKCINVKDSSIFILQSVIESPGISLYMRDESDMTNYYVSKEDKLYKLENNEIIFKNDEGSSFKKNDNKYIGILKMLMSDNPDIINKLDKITLTENDIIEVISEYNKGNTTYFFKPNSKFKSKPVWAIFAQYSNYKYVLYSVVAAPSYDIVTGLQYYFSGNHRHSFKFDIAYSNYNYINSTPYVYYKYINNNKLYSLGLKYEYDYIKTNNFNSYLMMNIAQFSYLSATDGLTGKVNDSFLFIPRSGVGFGLEATLFPHFNIYAEVNNLLSGNYLFYNFSLGFKYNFNRTN